MATRALPASVGQRLLWFLEHYRRDVSSLNCPVPVRLDGRLAIDDLRWALDALCARHEALRTTLERRGRTLVQVVHDPRPVDLTVTDLQGVPDAEGAMQESLTAEVQTPIDVTVWPVRYRVWVLGENCHVLVINMHHQIADAWSCGVVIRDLAALLLRPADEPLPPSGWQYGDFAAWQQAQLESNAFAKHRSYWVQQLRGMELPKLETVRIRDAGRRPATETVRIPVPVTSRLRAIAREQRTTLFAVLLAAYYVLLHAETGQRDLTLASLFSNRAKREVQSTMGFIANMVMLRAQIEDNATFEDLVAATRTTVMQAFAHEAVPYQMISLREIGQPEGRADDVVFQMLPEARASVRAEHAGVDISALRVNGLGSRFELELTVVPDGQGLEVILFYLDGRYDPAWAAAFAKRYGQLAARLAAAPTRPVSSLAQLFAPAGAR